MESRRFDITLRVIALLFKTDHDFHDSDEKSALAMMIRPVRKKLGLTHIQKKNAGGLKYPFPSPFPGDRST
jgi:hypothetical protein